MAKKTGPNLGKGPLRKVGGPKPIAGPPTFKKWVGNCPPGPTHSYAYEILYARVELFISQFYQSGQFSFSLHYESLSKRYESNFVTGRPADRPALHLSAWLRSLFGRCTDSPRFVRVSPASGCVSVSACGCVWVCVRESSARCERQCSDVSTVTRPSAPGQQPRRAGTDGLARPQRDTSSNVAKQGSFGRRTDRQPCLKAAMGSIQHT